MSETGDTTDDELKRRRAAVSLFEDVVQRPAPDAAAAIREASRRMFGARLDREPFSVGHRLGAYVIEAVLGQGGQARVYQARHLELGRRVALKVPTRATRETLVREARIASRIEHPRIVRVETIVDHSLDGENLSFLVMELCVGGSLAARLDRHPAGLHEQEATRIGRGVLEALAFAHHKGVVHRDIKPSNVLFDAADDVKVSDLGIGSLTTRLTGLTNLDVRRDAPVGTPAYVAPEQAAQGAGAWLDGRADLFSFGRLLFTALSGRPPAESESAVTAFRDDLSPAWDALIAELTASDPDRRPDTAEDVLARLAEIAPL